MKHLVIASIVFACVFGSALLGLCLRERLPAHHLSDESISVVKLATGLISTMAALVLGLLVSSAKGTFDTVNGEFVQNAADIIQFDRVLARYGPETNEIRTLLKRDYLNVIQLLESGDPSQLMRLNSPDAINRSEDLQRKVEGLAPHNDAQIALKARALQVVDEILSARWLVLLHAKGSIPISLLVVLVAWLSIIFGTFGLFAPRNGTIITALAMCALSTSGAIFLIEEMTTPLDGMVRASIAPMRDTFSRLGE